MLERLQKIIARAGIASRRHAEELIKSGLVTVNGETITELGSKADESKDHIKVQGKLLRPETDRIYLVMNKPPEVVSTMIDPEGRRTLSDLLYGVSQRVFPVGRLEYHSMGLVFLTNDGELANLILKAHQLPQTYELKLKTLLTFDEIESLTHATGARITRLKGKDAPWYEVSLSEARRDALRNRLFQTGHPVEKIKRTKIGNLAMESLPTGSHRPLSDAEVTTLRRSVQPGAVQTGSAGTQRAQQRSMPTLTTTTPEESTSRPSAANSDNRLATTARRPVVKRRPFQPKPKPGQAPRHMPTRSFGEDKRSIENFKTERPSATSRPTFKRPFDGTRVHEKPAASGPKPFKRPFEGIRGQSRPAASDGKPFKRTFAGPKEQFRPGASNSKPFKKKFDGPRERSHPPASGQKPFKKRFDTPRENARPAAAGRTRTDFDSNNREARGPKSSAPRRSNQAPREPGAFGRSKKNFRSGAAAGVKPGAAKRSGSGSFQPKRRRFTGPKGRS